MLDNSNRKMFNNLSTHLLSSLAPSLFASNISDEEQFKVRAGTVLSIKSQTEIINAQDFSLDYLQLIPQRLKIEICEVQSRLFTSGNLVNTSTWIKEITLATDHHCCNVELEAEKEGLVLQVKRTISPGEPLLMWFGEKFRAIFDIPFLTGCHIEENLTYKCHLCGRIFDGPNILKLHIALKCDKLTINYLWQSLAIKYNKPSFLMSNILRGSTSLQFQYTGYQTSPINLQYNNTVQKLMKPLISPSLESPFQLCKPSEIVHNEFNDSLRNLLTGSSRAGSCNNGISPMIVMSKQYKIKSHITTKQSDRISAFHMVSDCSLSSINDYRIDKMDIGYNSEENRLNVPDPLILENEASSSGKTNDGNYQCVICHKRYSRKYGLKIHFRTHTGYKPLQCKYCGRAFGDPSNLNKHVRLHMNSENARYKCKYCDKGMVRRRDLERHIQKKHSID